MSGHMTATNRDPRTPTERPSLGIVLRREAAPGIGTDAAATEQDVAFVDGLPDLATRDDITSLADHAIRAAIILVGIAENIGALVSEHESIGRNIVRFSCRAPRAHVDRNA